MKNKLDLLKQLLEDRRIYGIVVALRGPDTMHEALKTIFTARIRSFLLSNDYNTNVKIRWTNKISFDTIVEAILEVNEYDTHYIEHMLVAIDQLDLLRIMSPMEARMLKQLAYGFLHLAQNDNKLNQEYGIKVIKYVLNTFNEYIK